MIRFNFVVTVTFTLLGLVAAFPQMRYIRMAVPDVTKAPGDPTKVAADSQQNPSAASSLDSQQLKQTAILGGPVKFVPSITRIKTNPESLRSSPNPTKEIYIDLYEPETPKRKIPTYIDLFDDDNQSSASQGWQNGESSQAADASLSSTGSSWQNEGENTQAVDESHSSNAWQTGEENTQVNSDASHSSVANMGQNEDNSNSKTDSRQPSSSSDNNNMNADADDTQQDDKYNDSKPSQEVKSKTTTRKYNAPANTPEYPDEFGVADRRAPVVVPSSEMASYLKALGSRSDNFRRPAVIASANLAEQLEYGVPSETQFLQRIAAQQSELKELLIQVLYRQTTLRDDIHRIDLQLTHVQQGLGMHGASYNMHSRFLPAYQMG